MERPGNEGTALHLYRMCVCVGGVRITENLGINVRKEKEKRGREAFASISNEQEI